MMDIFERVESILIKYIPDSKIKLEDHLLDDFGLDGLAYVEFVMDIEEGFSIFIDDNDADKFRTVNDIVEYLEIYT